MQHRQRPARYSNIVRKQQQRDKDTHQANGLLLGSGTLARLLSEEQFNSIQKEAKDEGRGGAPLEDTLTNWESVRKLVRHQSTSGHLSVHAPKSSHNPWRHPQFVNKCRKEQRAIDTVIRFPQIHKQNKQGHPLHPRKLTQGLQDTQMVLCTIACPKPSLTYSPSGPRVSCQACLQTFAKKPAHRGKKGNAPVIITLSALTPEFINGHEIQCIQNPGIARLRPHRKQPSQQYKQIRMATTEDVHRVQ